MAQRETPEIELPIIMVLQLNNLMHKYHVYNDTFLEIFFNLMKQSKVLNSVLFSGT